MAKLERDRWEGACNEPQPFNWKHACQLKPGHRGPHRVNKGDEDISWTDGPVEIVDAKRASTYVVVVAAADGATDDTDALNAAIGELEA